MEQKHFFIHNIPAVLYGAPSSRTWIFLHGQMGCKEEGEAFAQTACPKGYQVLAIDLPGHGQRKDRGEELTPWNAVPELRQAMDWAKEQGPWVGLRANSIGAYFALLAFSAPDKALLVSPILDMERLIRDMMGWAGVTPEQLQREGTIPTAFGQTLSWEYLCYVRQHPIQSWQCPIALLYGERDNMTCRQTVDAFVQSRHARLQVMAGGEHWFHTPAQLEVLRAWEEENC